MASYTPHSKSLPTPPTFQDVLTIILHALTVVSASEICAGHRYSGRRIILGNEAQALAYRHSISFPEQSSLDHDARNTLRKDRISHIRFTGNRRSCSLILYH
ncbi:hypothetical protein EDD85DRAFT_499286 [Armillaria nabsnona]|nr:hypothetical protein EDD85DRAFT_499286 [Armillaria nabsnona]